MDTFEAIRTILAVRSYQDKPVPAEVTRRIVEAGWLSGSSMNQQPWHFVVIEDKEMIRKLAAQASHGSYIIQAPLVIVVAVVPSRFAISDGSRAIQSMVLAAWNEGVGSNWVGFSGMDGVKDLLGIPNHMDVIAMLPFGYPTQTVGKGNKKRKPVGEIASREQYGYPFEG